MTGNYEIAVIFFPVKGMIDEWSENIDLTESTC